MCHTILTAARRAIANPSLIDVAVTLPMELGLLAVALEGVEDGDGEEDDGDDDGDGVGANVEESR